MIAVGIVGFKNSGKTTLAVELGRELAARGVSAAAVKFTSHKGVDVPDTDSDRLRKSYGRAVFMTPDGTAVFWEGQRNLHELLPVLAPDVLVVEGGKELGWLPRVLLLRSEADAGSLDPGLALASYGRVEGPGLEHVDGVAALADLVLARGFALAGLDCGACGREDCAALARDIVAGRAEVRDCVSLYSEVEVLVDGRPLAMNPFVQRVFAASVSGMLRELKGYAPGDVEIRFRGR